MSYYNKKSYNNSYSNKPFKKPKTVGFDDTEAEEVDTDTDCDLDSEPGEGEYFEYLVDKLDCINSKLDSITEQYKKLFHGITELLKESKEAIKQE